MLILKVWSSMPAQKLYSLKAYWNQRTYTIIAYANETTKAGQEKGERLAIPYPPVPI